MSLDVDLMGRASIYSANITHNLTNMADAAGLYEALWRPEEKGYKIASDLIPVLETGLKKLKRTPAKFRKLSPENGWGSYDGLVGFVAAYLEACRENPDAEIEVSR